MASARVQTHLPCAVCNTVGVYLNFWPTLASAAGEDTSGTFQRQLPAGRFWTSLLGVQKGSSCTPLFSGWRATFSSWGTLGKSPKHLYHLPPLGVNDSKLVLKATSHPHSPGGISQPALAPGAQGGTIGIFIIIYLYLKYLIFITSYYLSQAARVWILDLPCVTYVNLDEWLSLFVPQFPHL